MAQRYKFSVESKSFPLDISGEPRYTEPFKADKRKVIALAVELDDQGKGLVDWKQVGVTEQ